MRKMIHVTQDDIDGAKALSEWNSPIARALIREVLPGVLVYDAGWWVQVRRGSRKHAVRLDPDVQAQTVAFDRGEVVHPFSFELDIPRWSFVY